MNRFCLMVGVSAATFGVLVPQAFADGYRPYVSVFGGAAFLTKDIHIDSSGGSADLLKDSGYIVGGVVGVDWGNQLRTELELSHGNWTSSKIRFDNKNTYTSGSTIGATYLLGNAWYDLAHATQFTPYVGGGLGIGWVGVNSGLQGNPQFNASGLAFQLGGGIRFNVSDHLTVDFGYRFKDVVGLNYTMNMQGTATLDSNLASHNFQVGLTYQF